MPLSLHPGTIGTNSCNGDTIEGPYNYYGFACYAASGTIGNNSCFEYAACYQDEQRKFQALSPLMTCTTITVFLLLGPSSISL
jgi:hypothetical protein